MRKPLIWLIGLSALGGSLAVAAACRGRPGHHLTATHARGNQVADRADRLLVCSAAPDRAPSICAQWSEGATGFAVYDNVPLYVAADWNRLAGLLEEVPVRPAAVRGCRLEPLGGPALMRVISESAGGATLPWG